MVELKPEQKDAVRRMHNGCILHGGTGVGKSITAIAYFFTKECGGMLDGTDFGYDDDYIPMNEPKDLYIITTAKKRDDKDWEKELARFLISPDMDGNLYSHDMKVVIDSWNNIGKYKEVKDSFFIFDEQRVTGYGPWVKSFLKIAKQNRWILLSATPGDCWMDYLPVFIANGYFKNKREFVEKHVRMGYVRNYPEIKGYLNEGRLHRLRMNVLVPLIGGPPATLHHENVDVEYDWVAYRNIFRKRWNTFKDSPIQNVSELCQTARRIVNSDHSRIEAAIRLVKEHPKAIIFYNYDYELELLKKAGWPKGTKVAEWNGHKHQAIPAGDKWVYLVQYNSGAEGWNCIETDTTIFYSLNYSYKMMEQAAGRINRMNTPFKDLYYYRLKSGSSLDLAIMKALRQKKNFNEKSFAA